MFFFMRRLHDFVLVMHGVIASERAKLELGLAVNREQGRRLNRKGGVQILRHLTSPFEKSISKGAPAPLKK